MKIQFYIHYNTQPGQKISVTGSCEELGQWKEEDAFDLQYAGNGHWRGNLLLKNKPNKLKYHYLLKEDNGHSLWEWGEHRVIQLKDKKEDIFLLHDTWHWPGNDEKALYSSAFQKVIMPKNNKYQGKRSNAKKKLEFRIRVPRIGNQYQICVLGGPHKLGAWDWKRFIPMSFDKDSGDWRASVDVSKIHGSIAYKYGVVDSRTQEVITLEEGQDRYFMVPVPDMDQYTVVKSDAGFRFPLGLWKGAGVSVPVFSLRSDDSFGIGEFRDLIPFIRWSKSVGMKMVQILPINETIANHSWLDSYPYKSISVVALHPIYLNPIKMGRLKDEKKEKDFIKKARKLNREEDVNYIEVLDLKSRYFKLLYDQEKDKFFESKAYKEFYKENKDWLIPYAGYAYLRDKMGTADFRNWGDYRHYDRNEILKLIDDKSKVKDDILIHLFIQYHLDQQLREVTDFARENGVVLKGDIPIGISPNSVEAWTEPHLFNLDGQAGAPPDSFAIKGQNWGFPTYRWDAMAKENFDWWKFRLRKMNQYFDAYRIDHILGFFRIWEIPMHAVEGILGYFKPCLPLSAQEIEQKGIHFDYERLVKPYIRYHILYDHFGMMMHDVVDKYLDDAGYDQFKLKPEFDTQQKINAHFLNGIEEEDLTVKQRKIRDGLFDLVSNVIFLEIGENQWHPRVNMHFTSSYKDLDDHTRHHLDVLYNEFYYRRHNDFWYHKGMEKLPAILSASDMLVCGEDLGMVPDCVAPVMDQLNILSLEIQRMPKNPRVEFAHPSDAPFLSVCTTSTHDMSTIRGWWESDPEKIQKFYNDQLGNEGGAPFYAEPWICQQIITQHLYSTAMWVIFPIQDLLAMDGELRWSETHREQINVPSDVRHHWKFRMKQSIEELKKAKTFNELVKTMIHKSGRDSDF
jgi:4-alpha-glucanotransferase